jgi:hypothetical protein
MPRHSIEPVQPSFFVRASPFGETPTGGWCQAADRLSAARTGPETSRRPPAYEANR